MDNTRELVTLEGIFKGYETHGSRIEILSQVDFTIKAGETIAVVGSSGIGKSTLLHILGTLDRPDQGRLLFQGENLLDMDDESLARYRSRKIGFVFQFHHLLQGFSALENVMIPPMINKMSRKNAEIASREIIERVGLRDRMNHRSEDLSGGEQQRVALARALVMKPALLLADEPTGNLDTGNSRAVHQLLLDLNREFNMTMIVVTHNGALAALMDRRVTILDGKIVPRRDSYKKY